MALTHKKIGDIKLKIDENGNIMDGTFKGHQVTLKKVEKSAVDVGLLDKLVASPHPNIQRLFGYSTDKTHHYLALEQCSTNLTNFMKTPKWKKFKKIVFLQEIAEGLKFLHSQDIVHGNINPKNIFIDLNRNSAKISNIRFNGDPEDQTYKSAELLITNSINTKQSDIFSLGCIFFYALAKGVHPFKDVNRFSEAGIIENIKEGRSYINSVTYDEEFRKWCATDLIKQMTNKNPEKRPCCKFVLNHVLFWEKFKIFNFVNTCNLDESELKCFSLNNYKDVIGNEWTKKVNQKILTGNSDNNILTLIKVMSRTVKYFEPELNKFFETEHINFWLTTFPKVLSHIYNSIVKPSSRVSSKFEQFLPHLALCNHLNENTELSKQLLESEIDIQWMLHRDEIDFTPTQENLLNATKGGKGFNSINKVFKGTFKNTPVAIKEIERSKFKKDQWEMKILIKLMSDNSEESQKGKSCIIKFYGCFEDEKEPDYYYFVFERAETNLKELFFDMNGIHEELRRKIPVKEILLDIAESVHYIHKHNVIHFDIKLENILLVNRNGKLQVCLCDFGSSSVTNEFGVVHYNKKNEGTEIHNTRRMRRAKKYNIALTKEDDISHMGKVFSYILIEDLRKNNSDVAPVTIRKIAQYCHKKITYTEKHLLSIMIEEDDTKIVSADRVRRHPYFWTSDKKLRFLEIIQNLSFDYEEIYEGKEFIKKAKKEVFGTTDWREFKALNEEESEQIRSILEEYKKEINNEIEENNIFDLIRFILHRVKNNHRTVDFWTDTFDGLLRFCFEELEPVLSGEKEFYSGATPKAKSNKRTFAMMNDQKDIEKISRKMFKDKNGEKENFSP